MRKTLISLSKAWLAGMFHDIAVLPSKIHAAVFTVALVVSTSATAQGVTGFFRGWSDALNAIISLTLLAGMMLGIIFVLFGLVNLAKKGMNRGDDIEASKILWPIVGGALATIILYVIRLVVEESGASSSDMGRQL